MMELSFKRIQTFRQGRPAQLFVRSTRNLRLTQAGEQFLAHCRPALVALQQASAGLADGGSAFSGVLKLSAPSDFGRNLLLPLLQTFDAQHPGVELRLLLADRQANICSEPVDAAFRFGKPTDSELVALPLAPRNRRVLCAAPSHLARYGRPEHPRDLLQHRCLCPGSAMTFTTAGGSPGPVSPS